MKQGRGGEGRSAIGAAALTGVLALLAAAPAAPGSAPALPPGCNGNSFDFAITTPAPITGGGPFAPPITSTIQVSGAQPYLRDLDLVTDISHTHSADLDVTLTSPAGTVVTITTDNGDTGDDVFGNGIIGTRWDDDAGEPVSDAVLLNNVPAVQLVPEEAMAAFVGENPNGTWTLSVADDAGPDNGRLNRWSLELATLEGTPTIQTTTAAGTGGHAIPNPGPVSASAPVTAGSYLWDIDLRTDISHLASGDLDVALRSPAGTISTMTTRNGASFDDVFGGPVGPPETLWSDQAGDATADPGGGPVTDAEFANAVETDLVPEEAMGAFIGENPNGSWSLDLLDVNDGFGDDNGTLNAWSLSVSTVSGCTTGGDGGGGGGGPYGGPAGSGSPLTAQGVAIKRCLRRKTRKKRRFCLCKQKKSKKARKKCRKRVKKQSRRR